MTKKSKNETYLKLIEELFDNNYELLKEDYKMSSIATDEQIVALCEKLNNIAPFEKEHITNRIIEKKIDLDERTKKEFYKFVFTTNVSMLESQLINVIFSPFPGKITNKVALAVCFIYFITLFSSDLFINKRGRDTNLIKNNRKILFSLFKSDLKEAKRTELIDFEPLPVVRMNLPSTRDDKVTAIPDPFKSTSPEDDKELKN